MPFFRPDRLPLLEYRGIQNLENVLKQQTLALSASKCYYWTFFIISCIQKFHMVKIDMDHPVAASSKMWKHLHVQLPPNGIMVRWNDTVCETTINFMGLRQLLPIIILREGVISRRLNITLVICRASSVLESSKKFLRIDSKYFNMITILDKIQILKIALWSQARNISMQTEKMDLTNYLAWLPFAYPQIGGHLRPSLLTRRKITYERRDLM